MRLLVGMVSHETNTYSNIATGRDQFAERVLYLLRTPGEAARLGAAGRERVREGFLISRLMRDEMRLLASL